MEILEYFEPMVQFLDGFGLIGLIILIFTEAIINPTPPETLFLPMVITDGTVPGSLFLALIATIASCLLYTSPSPRDRG